MPHPADSLNISQVVIFKSFKFLSSQPDSLNDAAYGYTRDKLKQTHRVGRTVHPASRVRYKRPHREMNTDSQPPS